MKKLIYLLAFSLFVCLSCSKDEPIENVEQSILQEDISVIENSTFFDFIMTSNNSDNNVTYKNSEDKRTKPYWSAEYSNFFNEQGRITARFRIPDTDLLIIYDYPINGEDRIHINGEYGHITWNIKEPKVFAVDLSTGLVIYSNWCEENRTGFFQETFSGKVFEQDLSGDGEIDVWQLRACHEGSKVNVHIKTTLTDSQISRPWEWPNQGECKETTTEIDFDFQLKVKNNIYRAKVELAGETYEWEFTAHC